MEELNTSQTKSSPVMKGGDGRYSYLKNSSLQRSGIQSSKGMIAEAIAEKLDIQNLLINSAATFRIADLGCSVGPNTFFAVQNIIEAVDLKYKSSQPPDLEFHVFFNDHVSNDFNTLFDSLPPPPERRPGYFSAGVPGSFYTSLFPRGSLHFVHSSTALQWLSRVPKEVVDINSPAWNKGRIHYSNASREVVEAYSAQYVEDMDAFLHARAQEIVCGGLMVILVPAIPNGTPPSEGIAGILLDLLGSCLMDMAKMGRVDEANVDSFNLPVYITSPEEIETSIKRNGWFTIERMEDITSLSSNNNAKLYSDHIRAGMEETIKQHFGSDILDELFNRYTNKLEQSLSIFKSGKSVQMFVLLKRKAN